MWQQILQQIHTLQRVNNRLQFVLNTIVCLVIMFYFLWGCQWLKQYLQWRQIDDYQRWSGFDHHLSFIQWIMSPLTLILAMFQGLLRLCQPWWFAHGRHYLHDHRLPWHTGLHGVRIDDPQANATLQVLNQKLIPQYLAVQQDAGASSKLKALQQQIVQNIVKVKDQLAAQQQRQKATMLQQEQARLQVIREQINHL